MKISRNTPFSKGYNEIVSKEKHPSMMGMEFGVISMEDGDEDSFNYNQEAIYVLMTGKITFSWNNNSETVERNSCFHEAPILLHVPQNTAVSIKCLSRTAEVAVSRTENTKKFQAKLLKPEDCLCANEERGAGTLNECSTRLVRTFFDRSNCPETNFFVGEVVSYPGKWSSFPPHTHVEPEIYFYKFLPENGYGLAEMGDDAYKVKNNELTGMPCNTTHAQSTAPGYAEYYLWVIRLRDAQNIITTVRPEYEWTTESDAKYFPEL
ncbi:5-deoxy-glucuronate isomerase [Clostridium tyrobutyricum]|uniref:5-deoxy-glucuronate isomerase n=1 Tax=Clostridium tyrobutyricum TaxID=1519 RepID=UPI0002E66D87|nr:5-deoxy-glucuronate isomerase [Clostridium tyrobutyricum]MBV4415621.1 5-deoxy-glucuronate isomerase [Clostridium tyrobutyricum]MBV4422263.1 5-deoxy-glucuronate isomerase [Clostridium tyrobutyricum]MBV4430848.1 5-deoxy-glucuronate isomerase [Clostridium tyrobutyricum]MEA5009549.1 5-deoxy-glucuronate isomerase [Clostridium tyrobutyricum]